MIAPLKASKIFGAGEMYGVLNTSTPTPTNFDTLQDWTVTFKRDTKSITGQNQFPDDVCAGPINLTWKATLGGPSGRIFGDLVTGMAPQSNMYNIARGERHPVNSNAAITVTNNGSGVYLRDLGVIDTLTNLPMIRVSTITKRTHYTVGLGGKYMFHTSRVGDTMATNYEWIGNITGNGAIYQVTNEPQGKIGDFSTVFASDWNGEQMVMAFNSNIVSDHEIGTKNGDYGKPTLGGTVQADNYGNVATFSFPQQR